MNNARAATLFLATTLGLTGLAALPVVASSHGNALVHARKYQGELYMMNAVHMSLYTFDKDGDGVSNCYGECAAKWPPATLPAGTKLGENYTLIARKDGTLQIAYKGRPLYLYSGDSKIGDRNGDGIDGVWHLARPLP